jgi:hypothetical protein
MLVTMIFAPPAAGAADSGGLGATALSGPFGSIVFSRTELTAADNCVPNDTNIARLDTEVAPYLRALGMTAVGTLQTATVAQHADLCVHYNSSMMASWDHALSLSNSYGWSFVSHTATYPLTLDLTPAQSDAETCGSAVTIDNHGLPGGHGMIAYPGDLPMPTALHTGYGSKCFAWGRWYGDEGITAASAGTTSPYWQRTLGADGGPCNDITQPCYTVPMISGAGRYMLPSRLINAVRLLGPDEWFTLQSFILVKGRNPAYAGTKVAWDCTSSNPALHWSNDNERYCYSDWQTAIQALAAVPGVRVTDPLTVGIAFGRPATYPNSALAVDTTPPSTPGSFRATAHTSDPGVSLSWTASTDNTGVVGYRLERSTDQAQWTVLAGSLSGTSYNDAATSYGTTYYYRVRAFDAAGNGSPYATTSVTTPTPPPVTQYVTNSSFESGSVSGWSGYNRTSSIAAVKPGGGAYDGIWAARATNTMTSAGEAGILSSTPHWVSSTVAGRIYTARAQLSGPAGTVITVQLRECNAAGTTCPGLGRVSVTLPASGWVTATVPYTARANSDALRFSAYGTLAAAGSFLVDAMTITAPAS